MMLLRLKKINDLNDEGFDNSGLFWKFSFAGMEQNFYVWHLMLEMIQSSTM